LAKRLAGERQPIMRPVLSGSWVARVAVAVCAAGIAGSAVLLADGVPRSAEWPRVLMTDPFARGALLNTLERATKWLGDADCREVFRDFRDDADRPLEGKLTDLGISGQRYLSFVIFRDASGTEQ